MNKRTVKILTWCTGTTLSLICFSYINYTLAISWLPANPTNIKTNFNSTTQSRGFDISFSGTIVKKDITIKNLQIDGAVEFPENLSSSAILSLKGKTGEVLLNKKDGEQVLLSDSSFEMTGNILKNKINIQTSRIITSLFEASAAGEIDLLKSALDLSVVCDVNDLSYLIPDIKGSGIATVTVNGTYDPINVEGTTAIDTTDFSVSQSNIDDFLGMTPKLKANVSYRDLDLAITDGLLIAKDNQELLFSASWKDNKTRMLMSSRYMDHDIEANLVMQDKNILLEKFNMQGAVGVINAEGKYEMTRRDLQASITLVSDKKLHASLDLSGELDQLLGKGSLTGEGAFPYDFNFEGQLQQTSLTLNTFTGTYGPNKIGLQNPVDLMFTDNAANLGDMVINLNDGLITTTGAFKKRDFIANISASNIPANLQVFPFVFDGQLDGDAALSGSYENPEGKAQLNLKHISIPGIQNTEDRYVEGSLIATLKDNELHTQSDLEGPEGLQFNIDATLPLTLSPLTIPFDKPVQAKLNSSVDLRAISILLGLDEQRITGQTSLDISLSGSLNKPVIKGTGNLRNGTYENLLLGTLFKDITADFTADNNQLTLTLLEGKDNSAGHFRGSGRVELKNIREPSYEITLNTEQIQFINLDSMGLIASGNLKSTGDKDKANIEGSIIVKQAEYFVSKIIETSSLSNFEIVEENAGDESAIEKTKTLTGPELGLDINIAAKNNIFVRGPDLETEWGGRLAVTGTANNPIIKGEMNLVRGNFQLLDTLVLLSKGNVSFIKPDPSNPVIDISGVIRGRKMDAILSITGEAQTPEVSISSETPLPEDEILANTLFGKSMNQLSPVQVLRIAQLMAYLSGQIEAGISPLNNIRRAMGFDTLSVGLDEEKGATLSVGKYINDRIFVGVEQGTSPESTAVRTEVEITEKIELETSTGAQGESSIGVNWKLDY